MENKFGFDLQENLKDIEKKKDDDLVLGAKKSLPFEILQPDGQWGNMPMKEYQRKNGLETMNCTVFATLNCLEALQIKKYKEEKNWSDRFIGILANTTPSGNLIRKPIETVRNFGMIDENILPFSNTIRRWSQYYNPKPMTQKLLDLGKKWFEEYERPGHEWIYDSGLSIAQKQEKLKIALQSSPLAISVYAWRKGNNGLYYKKSSDRDNHLCVLIGYKDKVWWNVFDTYDGIYKKLEWNYNFSLAKRFNLIKTEKSMLKLYKDYKTKTVYIRGENGDGLYHPVLSEKFIRSLYGAWDQVIVNHLNRPLTKDEIGFSVGSAPFFLDVVNNILKR